MVIPQNDFNRLRDQYEKAGSVPAGGFSKKDVKNKNAKLIAIRNIIELAKRNIIEAHQKFFKRFDVNFEFSSTENKDVLAEVVNAESVETFKDSSVTVAVNFNFSKLGKMPADMVYAIAHSAISKSLRVNFETFAKEERLGRFDKKGRLNNQAIEDDKNEIGQNQHNNSILSFIEKVICKFLGLSPEDSKKYAKDISYDLQNKYQVKPEDLFKNPDGEDLFVERYGKLVEQAGISANAEKQNYLQESTYLLGEVSKDKFEALKTNDESKIKDFCESYARSLLNFYHINPSAVEITFNPEGAFGEYTDNVSSQSVNINLDKIKRLDNPAEVVVVLSHELTHAIDSTMNKAKGIHDKDGYGLVNGLGESVNMSGGEAVEKLTREPNLNVSNYFKRLQEICYRVDPDERSAKIGELTALKFMQGLNPDETTQSYIAKSVDRYEKYQGKVIDALEQVSSDKEFEKLISEYNSLKGDIQYAETKTLIEERLEYLKNLKTRGLLDSVNEKKSLEEALKTKNQVQENELHQDGVEMSM